MKILTLQSKSVVYFVPIRNFLSVELLQKVWYFHFCFSCISNQKKPQINLWHNYVLN